MKLAAIRSAALLAIAMSLSFTTVVHAQSSPPREKYFAINPPQPTESGGKVEVIEVFSHGCIHCAHFQPYVDEYLKRLDPAKVQFSYLPATFNPQFMQLARGFYAAESIGATKSTHQGVFTAIFEKSMPVRNSFDDVTAIYVSLGVKRDAFMKAAQSFQVETQLRRANDLIQAYRIDGTPTIVVAGKYRVTGESAGGNDKVFAVVDELVARELAAKRK